MRIDPSYVTSLVSALDGAQGREQQLSTELSSGVRFNSLSEDPIAAGKNVLLLNQIQRDDSFTQNTNLVTGQLQVADSALGSRLATEPGHHPGNQRGQRNHECDRRAVNRRTDCGNPE